MVLRPKAVAPKLNTSRTAEGDCTPPNLHHTCRGPGPWVQLGALGLGPRPLGLLIHSYRHASHLGWALGRDQALALGPFP